MQDMYTFFPPLTVLPHGKVLYLYPADRARRPHMGAHSPAKRAAPSYEPHFPADRARTRIRGPHSPAKLSAPAYRLHMGPPCGRRGTKYRGMISYFLWWKFSK